MNTEKLIPFDLEKAKDGYKIVTRDGKPVTEWKHFEGAIQAYPIYSVFGDSMASFTINGRYVSEHEDRPLDLFLLPRETSVYRNVYADGYDYPTLNYLAHTSLDSAIVGCKHVRTGEPIPEAICVLRITTTETGQTTAEIVHHYNS